MYDFAQLGNPEPKWRDLLDVLRFSASTFEIRDYLERNSAAVDTGARQFVNGCLDVFEKLAKVFGEELKQVEKKKQFPIVLTIIGESFAKKFTEFCFSSFDSDDEPRSEGARHQLIVYLCVDQSALMKLRENPQISMSAESGRVRFVVLPDGLTEPALRVVQNAGGNWSWPITFLTNSTHYAFLEGCRLNAIGGMVGWPDMILSKDLVGSIINELASFNVVCADGYRVKQSIVQSEVNSRDTENRTYSEEDLIRFVLATLADNHLCNHGRMIIDPFRFIWKVSDGSFFSTTLNVSPLAFKFTQAHKSYGGLNPSLLPVDGVFASRFWRRNEFTTVRGLLCEINSDSKFDSPAYSRDVDWQYLLQTVAMQANEYTVYSLSLMHVHSIMGPEDEDLLAQMYKGYFDSFSKSISANLSRMFYHGQYPAIYN
jgi:hypothetical protein